MPGIYEYTIMMQDRASGTLQKLTGSSYEAVQKFVTLQDKIDALKRSSGDFGNSIYNLKQKVDILQQERDLIDPSNLTKIRQYNKEIRTLTRSVSNLENTTGGKFKTYLNDAMSQVPGAGLMKNPLVMAAAGVTAVGKLGVSWEEGMAKINATAQLPQKELDKLSSKIKKLGVDAGVKNLSLVPDAYEKILSQTGDVVVSTDILDKALKGAKAGFTDVNLVAGATAQSLSAIGKENTDAQEVLDTLFAAKRVGAGEFADFARYLPSLFAASKNIGAEWKETAGLFAYMTGKGQEAGNAAMYIQNAYNALGKSDITGGLSKAGVKVFDDTGKMREMIDIFTDLSKLTQSMTDQQKSDFLESIGLRDQQAKAAFSILTDETEKLRTAIDATANGSGELQNALDNTNNTGNKLRETWAKIQGVGESLGSSVLIILNPALEVLSGILGGVAWGVEGIGGLFSWWNGLLQQNNPIVWGLTGAIGTLTGAYILYNTWQKLTALWEKKNISWKTIHTVVTNKLRVATNFLKVAFLQTPFGWIAAGIMVVVAAYKIWENRINAVAAGQQALKKIEHSAWKSIIDRKVQLEALTKIVSDSTRTLEDRNKALTELQRLYPKEFEYLNTQNALTGKAIELKNKLIDKMFQEAKVRAAQDKLTELAKQEFELMNDPEKSAPSFWQDLGNSLLSGGNSAFAAALNNQTAVNNLTGGLTKIQKERSALEKFLTNNGSLEVKIGGGNENGNGNNDNTSGNYKNIVGSLSDTLSLGIPQNYAQSSAYAAIASKLGGKAKADVQTPTEKPVKSIAARVDEINYSLKKMAAAVAVPVALTVGAASAGIDGVSPDPVSPDVVSIADQSINKEQKTGKTVYMERFTDKIEIHVHGSDAPKEVADRVRTEVEKALEEILNV